MNRSRIIIVTLVIMSVYIIGATHAAAGPYEGRWVDNQGDFQMVRSVGETILLVGFGLSGNFSQIWVGTLDGNKATIQVINADYEATAEVILESSSKATLEIKSCSGNCAESFVGKIVTSNKIF